MYRTIDLPILLRQCPAWYQTFAASFTDEYGIHEKLKTYDAEILGTDDPDNNTIGYYISFYTKDGFLRFALEWIE